MTRLRNYFLTGFVVCAPLAITAYIAWSVVGWVDSWVKPYIPARYSPDTYLPFQVPGFGLIVALFLITMIGFLTANIVGRAIVNFGERLLGRMPLVRGIYGSLKQIFETVLSNKGDMFRQVGLVEYPRKGVVAGVRCQRERDRDQPEARSGRRPADRGVHAVHAQPDHRLPDVCAEIRHRAARHDDRGWRQADRLGRAGGA